MLQYTRGQQIFRLCFLLPLIFFCLAMGGKGQDSGGFVTLDQVSILDEKILARNAPIVVNFSDPMVAAQDVDKTVAQKDMPFSIIPAVAGKGIWLTQSDFSFISDAEFPRGKDYFLLMKENLQSLDKRPVRYYLPFRTAATIVKKVSGTKYDGSAKTQNIIIEFNLPVSEVALREHLTISDSEKPAEFLTFKNINEQKGSNYSDFTHEIIVNLGKERKGIKVYFKTDTPGEAFPLGLAAKDSPSYILSTNYSNNGSQEAVPTAQSLKPSTIQINSEYAVRTGLAVSELRFYIYPPVSSSGDQSRFIKVSPDLPFHLDDGNYYLNVGGKLIPGMEVKVSLKPGLVDNEGKVLAEERSTSYRVPDHRPGAAFSDNGTFLTSAYGSRLGLDMVNVDEVSVSLSRQFDNNLPLAAIFADNFSQKNMEKIGYERLKIEGKKNEIETRSLDLAALAKGRKGVFSLTVEGYKEKTASSGAKEMFRRSSVERVVVLSDIGLSARVFPDSIIVFASSLSTALPLQGTEVKIYSESNQLLAEGITDQDGLFVHARKENWQQDNMHPYVATALNGEGPTKDMSYLVLDSSTSMEMPETAQRDYLQAAYEAFVYTPRGVFRPGEKVELKSYVRDEKHEAPVPFPVLYRVISARGLEIARGAATLSDEGGAEFAFTLPASAPTGEYEALVEIPGQKNQRIGQCTFQVEDFVPPRLEVKISPKNPLLLPGKVLPVGVESSYLFGSPGADLKYELGYKATPIEFSPEGFDGYYFGNADRSFDQQVALKYISGKLDARGLTEAQFKAPEDWRPASTLNVLLICSVQEDGGRWSTQTGTVTYFPGPYLLGLKIDGEKLAPGKKGDFSIAAVTPEGKTTDCGPLKAEIYYVQRHWNTVYRNNRYVYVQDERLYSQETQKINTSGGRGKLSFTPGKAGLYLVRLTDKDGKVSGSRRISVWGGDGDSSADGSGRMDKLELSLDKSEYRLGETAKLSIKSPYPGTLLLGLEHRDQLSRRVIALPESSSVVEIPVTEEMDPNITITASVIRPVKAENREWFAHRAAGAISLGVSKAPHTLTVSANSPERAKPSEPLAIPFTVCDENGKPMEGEFSVALVDEGILSLTGFKTPSPIDFFMAKRRSIGRSYDFFDQLLRPEVKASPLLKAGGDTSADYQGSLSSQQIFLTAFIPTVLTDSNGQGLAEFDIPEYSGKGRLMVVGAAGARFASSSTQVRFARDLVVESTAPRAVAPGDSFDIPVKLFTLPDAAAKLPKGLARIKVSSEGPLELTGKLDYSFDLEDKKSGSGTARSLSVKGKALKEAGIAKLTVSVSVEGRKDLSFEKTLDVVVRPPYPRTSSSAVSSVQSDKVESISLPGKWLKGTEKLSFSLGASPVLSILPALEYLREYPYGCLEQTTSKAWPYLTIAQLQKSLDKKSEEANSVSFLATAVSRISSLQTADGGFGMWPGSRSSNPYNSVNAILFLNEAKALTPVSEATLEKSLGYLRLTLATPAASSSDESYSYTTKAFAAFVLAKAGSSPLGWIQHLSENESKMLPSGRIFLAGAKALTAGNPDALQALKDEDLSLDKYKLAYNESMESSLRNQSLKLLMWSLVAPRDKETMRLCLNVTGQLSAIKHFTPQDAGIAALALGIFHEKTGANNTDITAKISIAKDDIAVVTAGEDFTLTGDKLPLNADGSAPRINLSVSGDTSAFYVYSIRGVPFEAPPPSSSGLKVNRVWKKDDGSILDPAKGPIVLSKGERVTVELTVESDRPLANVVVSDLLPGGLEVENPRLKTAATDSGTENQETQDSQNSEDSYDSSDEDDYADDEGHPVADRTIYSLYMDLREDRLLVFYDRLDGKETYRYSMRAVSSGKFVLPPLAAEGMYAPECSALTKAGEVIVN